MDQPSNSSETPPGLAPEQALHAASRTKRIGIAVGLVLCAALAWFVYSHHRAAAQLSRATEAQSLVDVATTRPAPLGSSSDLVLPGNLLANYQAPIYARTSGYLRRWLTDIGTRVRKGQLLAQIESPEVDQQLRQAQANLANAEANQKLADVTAERWRHLRETDSVSKQEADEKISAAEASDAQVQAARANVLRLRELTGFEQIVAPFDGVITQRETDIGQLINAGSGTGPELFRIADMSRLRLYVRVPQNYAAAMREGLPAELHLPDRPGRTYVARVATTSSAIDTATRTLMVELLVDNRNGELLPGAYTEVHFELPPGSGGQSFELPANVLLFRGDGLHVAAVDAHDRVIMKPVTIGRDFGSAIEITTGVSANDDVILSPPDSLTQGALVRVVRRTGPRELARS
ncbi:MAG TPA: efflux RND transporter periplasmic adaptor subunit [Steroidobacteraceae bacterium]|nr:efflux RND transporter periplasmic adaptor subunit [Steroidobacteraceae bacterium]